MERLNSSVSSGTHGSLRTDAVAWLILAFWGEGPLREHLEKLSAQLRERQLTDGRVPIADEFPEAAWPTSLALLAWQHQGDAAERASRAVDFLLGWQGLHYANREPGTLGHDTLLRGWPWIAGTHSWVEPTALGLLALGVSRKGQDPRCVQARQMLLNRQLSRGGWNFGNTTVYGLELRPMPHSTGMALAALAGSGAERDCAHSVRYLKERVAEIRSPLSLGWGIIGLTAMNEPVKQPALWINECLDREALAGEYDLFLLSLLRCALFPRENHPLLPTP